MLSLQGNLVKCLRFLDARMAREKAPWDRWNPMYRTTYYAGKGNSGAYIDLAYQVLLAS
jgi:hypothetical protein